MPAIPMPTLFDSLTDPRRETKNKLPRRTDRFAIATCSILAGAETWEAIAEYGRSKQSFFQRFLSLENGIPSSDTFERVFAKLNPAAFSEAFGRWMAAAWEASGLIPIAIDGKSVRAASKATSTGCLHLVSAWATANRLTLGQVSVPEGTNEIAVIPELLRTLELQGAIVTLDAAGCQVENARIIREQQGHYLLAVHAAIESVFTEAMNSIFAKQKWDGHASKESGHGRWEER
jgi:hypothetical protein